jgi:hypothetical protein
VAYDEHEDLAGALRVSGLAGALGVGGLAGALGVGGLAGALRIAGARAPAFAREEVSAPARAARPADRAGAGVRRGHGFMLKRYARGRA